MKGLNWKHLNCSWHILFIFQMYNLIWFTYISWDNHYNQINIFTTSRGYPFMYLCVCVWCEPIGFTLLAHFMFTLLYCPPVKKIRGSEESFIRRATLPCGLFWASPVAQTVKRLPAMQETWVQSLGQEDPPEKEMATHSSTRAWKIPWTEEPGRLQSMRSQRVRHD